MTRTSSTVHIELSSWGANFSIRKLFVPEKRSRKRQGFLISFLLRRLFFRRFSFWIGSFFFSSSQLLEAVLPLFRLIGERWRRGGCFLPSWFAESVNCTQPNQNDFQELCHSVSIPTLPYQQESWICNVFRNMIHFRIHESLLLRKILFSPKEGVRTSKVLLMPPYFRSYGFWCSIFPMCCVDHVFSRFLHYTSASVYMWILYERDAREKPSMSPNGWLMYPFLTLLVNIRTFFDSKVCVWYSHRTHERKRFCLAFSQSVIMQSSRTFLPQSNMCVYTFPIQPSIYPPHTTCMCTLGNLSSQLWKVINHTSIHGIFEAFLIGS